MCCSIHLCRNNPQYDQLNKKITLFFPLFDQINVFTARRLTFFAQIDSTEKKERQKKVESININVEYDSVFAHTRHIGVRIIILHD